MTEHPFEGKKILIIRLGSMGDVLLTTPVVRCISKQWKCTIHFLTKPEHHTLLRENPYISRIHQYKKDIASELKKEKYDLIIDLHKNLRTFRLRYALGVKTISFEKNNVKKWFLVQFKLNIQPQKHIVERYFDALKSWDLVDDGEGLDFFIDPAESDKAGDVFPFAKFGVLILGGTYYTKRIPVEKCMEIIESQTVPIVLLGGKDVEETGNILNQKYPNKVIQMAGRCSIHISAFWIKMAEFVITGDTGLMHIATAFQKKTYVLWGNTVPELGMYPYYGTKRESRVMNLQVDGLSCRPCSKLGFDECPQNHFACMHQIDISPIEIVTTK